MKSYRYIFSAAILLALTSCFKAQTNSGNHGAIKIEPGSSAIVTSFFKPFSVTGKILEKGSGGTDKVFRLVEKSMRFSTFGGKHTIYQELSYFDEKGKQTGVHRTHYDPKTFQVLYWGYKGAGDSKTRFAFKAKGTSLFGTQDDENKTPNWRRADIGQRLFQNETRELLFRSLSLDKGSVVRFPIIGAKPPFHGWVSYKYLEDRNVKFNGKEYDARIWQTPNSKAGAYYVVIDDPPYVIKRGILGNPAGSHTFIYNKLRK